MSILAELYLSISDGEWEEVDENDSSLKRIFKFHPPGTGTDKNAPGVYQEREKDGFEKTRAAGDFTISLSNGTATLRLLNKEEYFLDFESSRSMLWNSSGKQRSFRRFVKA